MNAPATTVAIIGAGKMGLPIACRMGLLGARVIACDVRADVVDAINRGESPIDEPGVPEAIATLAFAGNLTATTNTAAAIRKADVAIVLVPAVLTDDRCADLDALDAVTRTIASAMHAGLLVVYETTVPVGTTRQRFLKVLNHGELQAGRDWHLAYSPERVKSRHVMERLGTTPKIVGGLTEACRDRAAWFYAQFLAAPVAPVASLEAAEFAKLAGMVYRDVNIALANELARYAEAAGIDLPALIPPTNTDAESALLQPGIGVGGHCTPVYPWFLIHDAHARGLDVPVVENARLLNDAQPAYCVGRMEEALGPLAGATVAILGLGFRPEVKEHLMSPAFGVRAALAARGARAVLVDPIYTEDELAAHGFEAATFDDLMNGSAALPVVDGVVLVTAHRAFASLDWKALAARGVRVALDGRNVWDAAAIRRAGIDYLGVGR